MATEAHTDRRRPDHSRLTAAERSARGRVAVMRRHHPDQPELVAAEVEALREAAAERSIRDLVAKWPPLSPATRNRLATLLAVPEGEGGAVEGAGDG